MIENKKRIKLERVSSQVNRLQNVLTNPTIPR